MSKESALSMLSQTTPNPTPEVVTTPGVVETPDAQEGLDDLKKDLTSTQLAAAAKWEAKNREEREKIKKEREALAEERKKADEILGRGRQFDETFSKDKLAALKLLGYSEADLLNIISGYEPKEPTAAEIAAQEAKKLVDERMTAFEKSQKEKEEKALDESTSKEMTQYRNDMKRVMEANKEKFEYCNYYGEQSVQMAYDIALQVAQDSKGEDVLTPEQAMEELEWLYEEEDKKMAIIKKRQPKVEAAPAPKEEPTRTRELSTPAGSTPPRPTLTKTRSLSNAATATSAAIAKRVAETPAQKRERLINALRVGKL